jgi:hypothetical protein
LKVETRHVHGVFQCLFKLTIPFQNHFCLGVKPQAVL